MNNNEVRKIPCEVVQDLIPLYADNLVSEKTREIIDDHVARCPSCAKAVNEAKDSLKENFDCESVNYEGKDVDYLRKVRNRRRRRGTHSLQLSHVAFKQGRQLFNTLFRKWKIS